MLNLEKFIPPSFASVAVSSSSGLRKELTYRIPDSFIGRVLPGSRVLVPLRGRKITGIVTFVKSSPDVANERNIKDILDILHEDVVFSEELLRLWQWAASYYSALPGEFFNAILPSGLRKESVRFAKIKKSGGGRRGVSQDTAVDEMLQNSVAAQDQELSDGEKALIAFIAERKRIAIKTLMNLFSTIPVSRILERLEQKGLIELQEHIQRSPRAVSAVQQVAKRVSSGAREEKRIAARSLSSAQQVALERIVPTLELPGFRVFLVQGVTGSGKTEIYLQAAQRALTYGRSVMILVPEIALTTQLVEQVRTRFGPQAAVLHSGLVQSERWREWQRIARGEAMVVVGARSAVFAPFKNLGLIVVDEEHDAAYKQGEGVRYNARDLAVTRGQICGCPVMLGSATPSLETHLNARNGRYTPIYLPERIDSRPLPEVEVVDLRKEAAGVIFSRSLQQALLENYQRGKQSLLFLNRRGYANYLQCHQCGEVVSCEQCSVTMTLHLRGRILRCHYCGRCQPAMDHCPGCHDPTLEGTGFGTEQVEEAVGGLLPQARMARVDRDSVSRRGTLERVLKAWQAHEIDVLIGTQMIAKGHDVPGVTLVGVLRADSSLHFPDFRAAERTFQILTQVAGRAGRGSDRGRVLIQTYLPDHYSIRCAARQDFTRFAAYELRYRKRLGYPPYTRMINIRCEGKDGEEVCRTIRHFAESLQAAIHKQPQGASLPSLLGPAPAPLERMNGRERWQLLIKGGDRRLLHTLVKSAHDEWRMNQRTSKVRIIVDVDPYDML